MSRPLTSSLSRLIFSFAVSDLEYLITFTVMLLVALVISTLTVRLRQQAEAARQRERRTAALYAMSRELARTRDTTISSRLQRAISTRSSRAR